MAKQEVIVKVYMNDNNKKSRLSIFGGNIDARARALTIAVGVSGVESASIQGPDKDQIVVTGEGIDSVQLTTLLRKRMGWADLITVGPVKEKENPEPAAPSVTTANASEVSWPAHPFGGFPLQVIEVPEPSSRIGWAW